MDDTLKRLLDAEVRAEQLAQEAEQEQEHLIKGAMEEARQNELQFKARIPALQQEALDKADQRAAQTIAELKRRYDERHVQLRDTAEEREQIALDAAFALLLDPRL